MNNSGLRNNQNPLPSATENHRNANLSPRETLNMFLNDLELGYDKPLDRNGYLSGIIKTLIKWGVLDARKRKD